MAYLIVSTTVESKKDAEELAKKIVKAKLGACVHISNIKSFYNWKGNLEVSNEFKLDIKTSSNHYKKLGRFILDNHKYELPEITAIRFAGYSKYLGWINGSLK